MFCVGNAPPPMITMEHSHWVGGSAPVSEESCGLLPVTCRVTPRQPDVTVLGYCGGERWGLCWGEQIRRVKRLSRVSSRRSISAHRYVSRMHLYLMEWKPMLVCMCVRNYILPPLRVHECTQLFMNLTLFMNSLCITIYEFITLFMKITIYYYLWIYDLIYENHYILLFMNLWLYLWKSLYITIYEFMTLFMKITMYYYSWIYELIYDLTIYYCLHRRKGSFKFKLYNGNHLS